MNPNKPMNNKPQDLTQPDLTQPHPVVPAHEDQDHLSFNEWFEWVKNLERENDELRRKLDNGFHALKAIRCWAIVTKHFNVVEMADSGLNKLSAPMEETK